MNEGKKANCEELSHVGPSVGLELCLSDLTKGRII